MKTRILVAAIATALAAAPAFATNGYFSHGYGGKSKGMAGAGSVMSKEVLVGATNPASITEVGDRVDLGLELFSPDREADVTAYNTLNGNFNGNETDLFAIPDFGYSKKLNDDVTAAFLMYGNGGMNTEYNCGIYSSRVGLPPPTSCTGQKTGVDMMQLIIAPTVAWEINDDNSIGVALNIAYQRFKSYGLSDFSGYTNSGTTNNLTDLGYDDSYGIGAKVGWTGEVSERLTVGAAYTSRTYMQKFDKYKELFAEQGDFDIPASINLGLAFQASPELAVAFDVQHIFYSDVKSIANANSGVPADGTELGNDNGKGFGWEDMTIFKLGLEYKASEDLVLRAGYSHGNQPIGANDTDFNLIAPAVIEDHATIGFTYTLDSGNEVTGFYMHAFENSVSGDNVANGGGDDADKITMNQNSVGVTYTWKLD
ncbi:MAG: outer membrane protein transport protein [Gammaproteobacteria bacterium]|nr:outer membrane protein transport protein [Gammaproteobacteria bacterium]MBU1653323.1 outer membrane protein transport protein [Gammaproteobacteria bacterium]MBU1961077.1 outer membrane protein transport protein [Gammaproteobacteria bacterium]